MLTATRILTLAAVAAIATSALALSAGAAESRQAYKHVDKDGKVTYSQTPPVDGKAATKVDIKPAQVGRGGDTGRSYHEERIYYPPSYSPPYRPPVAEVGRKPTPQEQRMAELKAECERNRGSDCNNPEVLRDIEASKIPRRRY